MKTISSHLILLSAMLFIFTGCAVNSQLAPIGGSRADGIVRLSYEYGSMQVPNVDWQQGHRLAKQRCAAWGYVDAERFEGETRRCISAGSYGCNYWNATVEYQCTGAPAASNMPPPYYPQPTNAPAPVAAAPAQAAIASPAPNTTLPLDKSPRQKINPKNIIVKYDSIKIYDQPGYSNIIANRNRGSILSAVEENDNWYMVEFAPGKTGWVAKDWVSAE